ncbi:MAG TPA: ASCH domain-containing protein [Allosphingosinicella sp.]|jgi:hypothetical protein
MSHSHNLDRASVALSVKQPWAELIMLGRKTIEVRTWSTGHRGALFLHTGRRPAEGAFGLFPDIDARFLGGFIGLIDLVDIEQFGQASWSRLRPQHLVPGPMPDAAYGWRLANPRRLATPMKGSGSLGIFPVPTTVAEAPLVIP